MQKDLQRPTAHQIYAQVAHAGREELERGTFELWMSGIAGGITMGLTGLGMALARTALGETESARFLEFLLYPLGFIAVIVGRAQLFTENTLYPVALVLTERKHFMNLVRLWAVVLTANMCGAFLFALLATKTGALLPSFADTLSLLGVEAATGTASHFFWSGVMGGWIIALVAWLVSGSHSVTGSVMIIYLLTFLVGAGRFAHCVASSGEILSSVLMGKIAISGYLRWLLPAVSGNICGGVLLVTLLEYGQVQDRQ